MTLPVTLADIQAAAARIAPHIHKTDMQADTEVPDMIVKCEYRQKTGAFKLRGATNAILSLPAQRRGHGVITASTGNHGRAMAHAAKSLGVPAVVCLSRLVPENKVDAIRELGAEVRIIGASQDDAMAEVARAVATDGMIDIPPFDDRAIVAGQGTLGLEIVKQCPEMNAILIPLSGGGLAAGLAIVIKALRPDARIIGVTMENGAAMAASLRAGHPVDVTESVSLADSLGGGIGLQNKVTFPICAALLDQVILVTEAEIARAIRHLDRQGHRIEGAAAVGHAAVLAGKFHPTGPTVTVLSGGNIDPALHARIMAGANAAETA
ncbi:hydroxyectoine utilization dehydratase EutB [Paracoccus sp. 11-3]|uniref:Hydroxyectoine utilization dehydratase EutB n=1 Tax=Paracoccus amoyensis TaxID=2760093 RepID=A0A926G7B5_9RHOB|nr:hydroxyectoine utilization dehydratase EutB [Paracoccus amoyensis]MBC9247153.1 hydroxyectoine utilization dehydratase EutB [Paracoccus amoyensis]